MIGGLFGLVGLGNVIGSQKTTPLDDRSRFSGFSALDKMELCDTPVEGAFDMRAEAEGVAVWRTGLLISGRFEVVGSSVEDLDIWPV